MNKLRDVVLEQRKKNEREFCVLLRLTCTRRRGALEQKTFLKKENGVNGTFCGDVRKKVRNKKRDEE